MPEQPTRIPDAASEHDVCGPDCTCGCAAGRTIPIPRPSAAIRRFDGFLALGLPIPDPREWECAICFARWFQRDGQDPQTHFEGCPNIRSGDKVVQRG